MATQLGRRAGGALGKSIGGAGVGQVAATVGGSILRGVLGSLFK